VSTHSAVLEIPRLPIPAVPTRPAGEPQLEHWYALHTRPRHEKTVIQRLEERGIATFLPLVTEVRRWSDRKKSVEFPLFSCYAFARFAGHAERLQVLRVEGVLGLVGAHGEGASIPEAEIDAVRALVQAQVPWTAHPFLEIASGSAFAAGR
jgi:transcription antitermination factor NusG